MVPNCKEPLYTRVLDFICEKRITFAASNFDTTSELTLQIVWWVQNRIQMETTKTETPMTEKDRWMLAAAICSAIGTAITAYFAGRK